MRDASSRGMQRVRAAALRSARFAAFFALLVAVSFPMQVFAAGTPFVPTVLTPKHGSFTSERLPRITGVTQNDTRVAVYIDGVFNGHARVANDASGVASFAYVPFQPLMQGTHTLFTRAEDLSSSARSELSKTITFDVAFGLSAPTVLDTVVDATTTETQPLIVGLAHGEYKVLVYIDGVFNGEAMVKDVKNGVGNFAYKPFLPLERGKTHSVVVKAVDRALRRSPASSAMTFTVPSDAKTSGEAAATAETTNGTGGEEPASTTPTEGTPAPEQNNEQTTGEEQGEVQGVQDETKTNANTNEAAKTNTAEAKNDDDGVNRSLVTWVIVLAVLIILAVLRLRSGDDRGGTPPTMSGGPTPPTSGGGTGGRSGTGGGSESSMPNPPPPSSNY